MSYEEQSYHLTNGNSNKEITIKLLGSSQDGPQYNSQSLKEAATSLKRSPIFINIILKLQYCDNKAAAAVDDDDDIIYDDGRSFLSCCCC